MKKKYVKLKEEVKTKYGLLLSKGMRGIVIIVNAEEISVKFQITAKVAIIENFKNDAKLLYC